MPQGRRRAQIGVIHESSTCHNRGDEGSRWEWSRLRKAMGLDNPLHIAFLVVILLLVFGAKRLPEIGRSLGSGMREFKSSITGEDQQTQPTLAAGPPQQQQPTAPTQAPVAEPVPTSAVQAPAAEPVTTPAPPEQPPAP